MDFATAMEIHKAFDFSSPLCDNIAILSVVRKLDLLMVMLGVRVGVGFHT
jgi:hypothetical protein